jgi:hypothetical protein
MEMPVPARVMLTRLPQQNRLLQLEEFVNGDAICSYRETGGR